MADSQSQLDTEISVAATTITALEGTIAAYEAAVVALLAKLEAGVDYTPEVASLSALISGAQASSQAVTSAQNNLPPG
jgi:hypothetical protein